MRVRAIALRHVAASLMVIAFVLPTSAQERVDPHSPEVRSKIAALQQAQASVVGIRSVAVSDARSSEFLGQVRQGSGVVIGNDGLVVTIGYLILEADDVELVLDNGRVIPAQSVANDIASGLALVQALAPLHLPPAKLGSSTQVSRDDPLMVASGGDDADLSMARLVARRAFSGYWEYHIDDALFTTPPRTDHSGAALFNANGELLGIGSLIVMDTLGEDKPSLPGNMFVPVDLLKSVLPELRANGTTRQSKRPWLGVNCVEVDGIVRIVRVTPQSPASEAGLLAGDIILRIEHTDISTLEGFYKVLWQGDGADRDVTLEVSRDGIPTTVKAHATDRMRLLRQPKGV